jgi:predicted dehydrogenase
MAARLVQIGLGGWGSDWAKNVWPLVETAQMVGFVDADPGARRRACAALGRDGAPMFATLEEALAAAKPDGIVAVLPTIGHKAVAEAALRSGKHVLVEKPFTASIREASELIELSERSKLFLMVSQNYRYHAAAMTAADLVRKRTYGRPFSATIEFRQDWKAAGHRYHDIPGPLLLDMGIHHFDMVRMIFAEDVQRVACRSWNTPYSPFKDHGAAHALLELESGVIVSYHGSWLRRGVPTTWSGDWAIECEEGELLFATRPGKPAPPKAGKLFLRRTDGKVQELATNPIHAEDRAGALDAFARAIVSGQAPIFFPSGRDNIKSLATSFACLRSSQEDGRWLALSELLP